MNFSRQMSFVASQANLAEILAFIETACRDAGLEEDAGFAVRLAGEEACCNIIGHAYGAGEPGPVSVGLRRDDERAVLTIEDRAPPFSPDDAPPPDLSADWENRRMGGLGWHLIRQMMDEIRHEPVPGGGNRLELVKRLRMPLKIEGVE